MAKICSPWNFSITIGYNISSHRQGKADCQNAPRLQEPFANTSPFLDIPLLHLHMQRVSHIRETCDATHLRLITCRLISTDRDFFFFGVVDQTTPGVTNNMSRRIDEALLLQTGKCESDAKSRRARSHRHGERARDFRAILHHNVYNRHQLPTMLILNETKCYRVDKK